MSGGMENMAEESKKDIGKGSLPIMVQVLTDMELRYKFGLEKYGKPVRAFDGENYLQHLYEELMDACVYIKAAIEEQKKRK